MPRLPSPWDHPVLSVGEAAGVLHVSRATAYRMAAAGDLPTRTANGRLVVPTAALYVWLSLPIPGPGPAPRIITR